jgi:hypothetical protein
MSWLVDLCSPNEDLLARFSRESADEASGEGGADFDAFLATGLGSASLQPAGGGGGDAERGFLLRNG